MASNSDDEVAIASAIFIVISAGLKKQNKNKKRRWWTTTLFKNRERYGGNSLLNDLRMESSGKFENFCRMSPSDFEYLFNLIGPNITKQDTHLRKCVSAKDRFAVTLRFLASGDSYQSLSYLVKISPQLISIIVVDVCNALKNKLLDQVKLPSNPEEWRTVSDLFEKRWNFPHCIGALDGKHIVILSPMNSGSDYINYKDTFSVVLMALCDADYNITYANIGCQGRISDGGVFSNCSLSEKLEDKTLNLPLPEPLPNRNTYVPYVILGDSAFPLKENIMVPYSGNHNSQSLKRTFQYRLSRARRTIENVFGIMSSVFRVLRKPILLDANKARLVTECCVLLHNFLRKSKTLTNNYSPPGTFDREENGQQLSGSWRNVVEGMTSLFPLERRGRRSSIDAKCIRQEFGEFFMTDGRVEWQDSYN